MSYQDLILHLRKLVDDQKLRKMVSKRIREFELLRESSWKEIFSELCFCMLTANSSAEACIRIQRELGPEGFLSLPEESLARKLAELGHRYPRTRARYIVEARKYAKDLKRVVLSLSEERAREWLVRNIKGIGMKEASHFLRNIGAKNLAIIDRHVLRALKEYKIINSIPRSLTKSKYLEIENVLRKAARDLGITLAELDLYLWYSRTGKVLK
ncbi:MAG: N-glycosylase/DNA lyase [Euryarchaeota archaeon]|nr:N-glycosylase/DNA lyase [Euryarchaeota archaeon]